MKDQRGVVALLSTIIFGLLLTVVSSSVVVVQVNELRQAEDADQSVKAYFAADAGVEDAVIRVRKAKLQGLPVSLSEDVCNKQDLLTGSTVTVETMGYTCQIITTDENKVEGTLGYEESVQIDVTQYITHVRLRWHKQGTDQAGSLTTSSFPGIGGWNFPAAPEIIDVSYPDPAITPINSADITERNIILRPDDDGIGSINDDGNGDGKPGDGEGSCTAVPAGDYACAVTLSIDAPTPAATTHHVFRMRPRYKGTHYKIEFLRCVGPCVAVNLPDQFASVDVTGKSGDVYRRMGAKIPLRGKVPSTLDYVIYSEESICKDFMVRNSRNAGRGEAMETNNPGPCPSSYFAP